MPGKKRPLRAAASGLVAGWRPALPALLAAALPLVAIVPTADAKSPGTRYCFHGRCYRVGTLSQTDTLVGWRGYVRASYYDSCHNDPLNPCGLTSSGAVFRTDLPDNAASPLLPDGTVILAYNPRTGDASVLRINNAGPYSGERKLDVSRAAADKLGFRNEGVASLVIVVLQSPTKSEATYERRRTYPPVPGYLGKFATVDSALKAAQACFNLREEAGQLALDGEAPLETSALKTAAAPKPQRAVSPSLARELVMLRSAPRRVSLDVELVQGPRLVSRRPRLDEGPSLEGPSLEGPNLVEGPSLVEGPRLVSRAAFREQPSPEPAPATQGFWSGLLAYLLGAPAGSD